MRMNPILLSALLFCTFTCWLALPACHAQTGQGTIQLEVHGSSLSASIRDATLRDVLEELKAKAGIDYTAHPGLLENRISVEFSNLPMEEALGRILADMSYSLALGPDKKVLGISVAGKRTEPPEAEGKPPRFLGPPVRTPGNDGAPGPSSSANPDKPGASGTVPYGRMRR